jgi:hypothetical protein
MLPPTMIHDWARKLIASEMDPGSPVSQADAATVRVYEHLRRQLCAPVGLDGFQALASRALSLAKSQSPRLRSVQVTASGGLRGLAEIDSQVDAGEEGEVGEVGIILIAQLLGLLLNLLGEAATVRLIEGVEAQGEGKAKLDSATTTNPPADPSYLGPFENILVEADQLRNVSERIEALVDQNPGIDELSIVAGNIRNIATVLDLFTLLRSKAGGHDDEPVPPPTAGYIN